MDDKEKVLTALKQCKYGGDCTECPYWYAKCEDDCTEHMMQDAIDLINQIAKERDEAIEQLRSVVPTVEVTYVGKA